MLSAASPALMPRLAALERSIPLPLVETGHVVAALAGNFHNATAQTINPTAQTASPREVAGRNAPATAAKPVAARVAPQGVPQPTGLNPQRFNANLPRMIAQPPANLQRTYWPITRTSGPNLATLASQGGGPVQQPISVDPATRQTELRTLAAMHQCRGIVSREGNILDPATRETHALIWTVIERASISYSAHTRLQRYYMKKVR